MSTSVEPESVCVNAFTCYGVECQQIHICVRCKINNEGLRAGDNAHSWRRERADNIGQK